MPNKTLDKFPEFIGTKDISKLLGISKKSVYKLLKSGVIPYRIIAGKYIIPKNEILKLFYKELD